MSELWRVWPIGRHDDVYEGEPDDNPGGPREAAEIACEGVLDFGGRWFAGGAVALHVEAPSGERWACAAWLTPGGPARCEVSEPVAFDPWERP